MRAYHWSGYEEGLVRKRMRRPKLRVIAGGGGKTTIARVARPTGAVTEDEPLIPTVRVQGAKTPSRPAPDVADTKLRHYYEHEHERRRVTANVDRLRHAIVDLAAIELPPSRLLAELSPNFDRPVIRERLIRAIDCLSDFAEAWCHEETTDLPPSSRRTGESGDS